MIAFPKFSIQSNCIGDLDAGYSIKKLPTMYSAKHSSIDLRICRSIWTQVALLVKHDPLQAMQEPFKHILEIWSDVPVGEAKLQVVRV